jgi:5'-3' exonuclease
MANILWIQPNQTLALTSIIIDGIDAQSHATELQERGDIPADWTIASYDVDFPQEGNPQEAYRWDGDKIVLDETALTEINAKTAEPTKNELLAELEILTAKINAITELTVEVTL